MLRADTEMTQVRVSTSHKGAYREPCIHIPTENPHSHRFSMQSPSSLLTFPGTSLSVVM